MPRFFKCEFDADLLLINALSVLLIVVIALFPSSLIRIVIGLPFVLFSPGYMLVCALFPKRQELDEIERLALSIGLSLAVVPLISLVLNYTPFGIRLYPVLTSLFSFMLLMSVVAMYRRKRLAVKDRFAPIFSVKIPHWSRLSRADKVLSVGFITSVVISGTLIVYLVPTPKERFTEFYVLGSGGKVADYPTSLVLGENATVALGIINHEYEEVKYKVVITFDNETIGRIDRIILKHEETWEQNVTFTADKVGERLKLEFLLYREDRGAPYRTLHLWLTVKPPQ